MITTHLGAWEKYFFQQMLRDGGARTNVMIVLDDDLDVQRIRQTLELIRPGAPLFFSKLVIDDNGRDLSAACDLNESIDFFIQVSARTDHTPYEYFRHVLGRPLDPFSEGLFRLHYVESPTPILGFQISHLAGDGQTFVRFRDLFVSCYEAVREGHGKLAPLGHELPHATVSPAQIRHKIATRPLHGRAKFRRHREPFMSAAVTNLHERSVPEWRTLRARLGQFGTRQLVKQSLKLEVTPLVYAAACLAIAVDRHYDNWCAQDGDYFAVNIPVDIRGLYGLRKHIGNLVYPVGIPLLKEDLRSIDSATRAVWDRFRFGRSNYLFLHSICKILQTAQHALVNSMRTKSESAFISSEKGTMRLHPLGILGVTELPVRRPLTRIGNARVNDYILESPIIMRRWFAGSCEFMFSLRYHTGFEARLRNFVQTFLNALVHGDAERDDRDHEIEWELI